MPLETAITNEDMSALRDRWASERVSVAFVPTMGALHAGHISLVEQARSMADRVVASIFVNPTQFGPNEDFSKYPRTLQQDLELLEGKADAVFLPTSAGMYPDGYQTYVINRTMSQGLCGASRVNHFEGVLTVVLKLFNIVRPDVAVFGKKDYQQWRLIETMAHDLNLRVRVIGGETVREPDGLALSSRNRYLSATERRTATRLSAGLFAARQLAAAGEKRPQALLDAFRLTALKDPGIELEYIELRRRKDLEPFAAKVDAPAVMLVAARVGTTRLIDNLELD